MGWFKGADTYFCLLGFLCPVYLWKQVSWWLLNINRCVIYSTISLWFLFMPSNQSSGNLDLIIKLSIWWNWPNIPTEESRIFLSFTVQSNPVELCPGESLPQQFCSRFKENIMRKNWSCLGSLESKDEIMTMKEKNASRTSMKLNLITITWSLLLFSRFRAASSTVFSSGVESYSLFARDKHFSALTLSVLNSPKELFHGRHFDSS